MIKKLEDEKISAFNYRVAYSFILLDFQKSYFRALGVRQSELENIKLLVGLHSLVGSIH